MRLFTLKVLVFVLFIILCIRLDAQDTLVNRLKLNSRYNEFAPAIYKDGIVFCSDRPSQFAISWVDAQGNSPTKIYLAENPESKAASILSEVISSKASEGSACFSADGDLMVYTGSITSKDENVKGRFGLFFSRMTEVGWSEPVPFVHNTKDFSYSLAYPSLSQDGNKLFYSSDMSGGFGGKDLYYSEKIDGEWSKPINLGAPVNTSSNESYPHITSDNKLYFSSDAGAGNNDLNIYLSEWNKGWQKPEKLDAPINSDSDDYALVMKPDNTSGYFSSGRSGRHDDIFSFNINYPQFSGCQVAELPMFCYYFEETNLVPNDTMPLIFEWEFGDGSKHKGVNAEHCYKDFGTYHVVLNVYDSLTKMHFAKISEIDVVIAKSPYPFIQSSDSVGVLNEILLSAEGTDIEGFTAQEYYWDSGHGKRSKGYNANFLYKEEGFYTVQLGIIGKNAFGEIEKRCAVKKIKVGNPFDGNIEQIRESVLQETMVFDGDKLTPAIDSSVYYVEFKQSEEQIPLTDDYFNNIKYEITERYDSKDTLYKYSVGETSDMATMVKVYKNLIENGYTESIVREESQKTFSKKTTNVWWYVPDSITASINRHLNKFNEIRFDLGTYTIRPESYDNLDYIGQVLNAEKLLRLKINAHTDNTGNDENNLILSQKRADSVIEYLKSKGIDTHRLEAVGHGENKPVANNDTEKGRAQNRRVEFEILFPE